MSAVMSKKGVNIGDVDIGLKMRMGEINADYAFKVMAEKRER